MRKMARQVLPGLRYAFGVKLGYNNIEVLSIAAEELFKVRRLETNFEIFGISLPPYSMQSPGFFND